MRGFEILAIIIGVIVVFGAMAKDVPYRLASPASK
ncbi:hypothetical protein AB7M23_002994 [Pseudomonas sp. HLS-6 TE3448]